MHYLSGGSSIFGIKEYAATLTEVVKMGNIKAHFGVNVVELDGEALSEEGVHACPGRIGEVVRLRNTDRLRLPRPDELSLS